MSGTAMSEEGGPIHLLFDSSGPDGREGSPHALCGFVFGGGEAEPPVDAVLKPQVSVSCVSLVPYDVGRLFWKKCTEGLPTLCAISGKRPLCVSCTVI